MEIFLLLLISLAWTRAESSVVLSEVMFDPLGSEYYDEYVELFNTSDTESVDLTGWLIGDDAELDGMVEAGEGIVLGPRQFGLILDSGYFEHSDRYDPLPEEALILTIDDASFGKGGWSNSTAESVILTDAAGNEIARYVYVLGNESGYSDEKIMLESGDSPENWTDSRLEGGTPGRRNSVTPFDHDVGVYDWGIEFSPSVPDPGEDVTITAIVHNLGIRPIRDIEVMVFEDADGDTILDEGEPYLTQVISDPIAWRDSSEVVFVWSEVSSGFHTLCVWVRLEEDEAPSNNRAVRLLSVSYHVKDVVINEVMFAPPTEESEWVELFNRSDRSVDLNAWTFSDEDSLSAKQMTTEPFSLAPGEYVVIAADSARFVQTFSDVLSRMLFIEKGWPALNNSSDAAVIRDATGKVIDRVPFGEDQLRGRKVSLERIHPDLSSDDPSTWTAHVTTTGGSPGARNSVYVERLPMRASLDASPNPFDERTILSVRLPVTTAYAHLWIYNSYGQLVRKLLDADPTGSERTVVWDGRDDDGVRLPMGIYVVYLEALNARKGILCREKKAVVLARRP